MEQDIFDIPMTIPHEFEVIDLQREIIKAKEETISLLKLIVKNYSNINKCNKETTKWLELINTVFLAEKNI